MLIRKTTKDNVIPYHPGDLLWLFSVVNITKYFLPYFPMEIEIRF
jgi:hypothetical protein